MSRATLFLCFCGKQSVLAASVSLVQKSALRVVPPEEEAATRGALSCVAVRAAWMVQEALLGEHLLAARDEDAGGEERARATSVEVVGDGVRRGGSEYRVYAHNLLENL